MTLQEVKLDVLRRGFTITENWGTHENQDGIFLGIIKFDTDRLRGHIATFYTPNEYEEENVKVNLISMSNSVEQAFLNRRKIDPNECRHNVIQVQGTFIKVCTRCMQRFGDNFVNLKEYNMNPYNFQIN